MNRRAPLSFKPDAYRVVDLIAAGVQPDRLHATDIRRIVHGIVLHPDCTLDPQDYRDRCIAVGRALSGTAFISHRSAAALMRLPVPAPPNDQIEIAVCDLSRRPPRHREFIGHRVKPGTLAWCRFERVTLPSPADVWCQLAAVLSRRDLVAAGDFVLSGAAMRHRERRPLSTVEQLAAACERHARSRGSAARRWALPLLRSGVDSPYETYLRLLLIEAGLPEPVVQCSVPTRERTFLADLGYPQLQVAIEYEGAHHFESAQQSRWDARRFELMRAAGWEVIRVMKEDMRAPEHLAERVRRAVALRSR